VIQRAEVDVLIAELGIYRVSPDVDEIEPSTEISSLGELVGKLDSKHYDQLYLELGEGGPSERTQICMSGGAEGIVVLFIIIPSVDTYYLCRADADDVDQIVAISSGGCNVDVFDRWLVPIDEAARGLYYFLLTGLLEPGLIWDRYSAIDFEEALRQQIGRA
jgi:hypothetical protein